jgi:preprotein translocase subunit SecG
MGFGQTLLLVVLFVTAIFLIVLVLIQRGKGGGLAGALGGMGGQSAFGTKAGDLFTKITIGVAFFWIVLCLAGGKLLAPSASKIEEELGNQTTVGQKDRPGPAGEKTPEKTPNKTPASTPSQK